MKKLVLSKETLISEENLDNVTAGGNAVYIAPPTADDGCSTWGSCPTKVNAGINA